MKQELVNAIEEIWGDEWEMFLTPFSNLKSVEMQHKLFPITLILDDKKVMLRFKSENIPIPFELLKKIQLTIELME